jgi:hypothetical protein
MGLFGSNKDDTRAKIEELKAKMQSGQQQPQAAPQQQPWQGQAQQAPQGWQPPREQQQESPQAPTQPVQRSTPTVESHSTHHTGILLELGDGMSLNLPIREKMELAEFLRIADRVRELKKIDHAV